MSNNQDLFQKAAKAISETHFLLIGAGAGMGADGGLPLYATMNQQEVFQKLGLSYDQVASPTMLVKDRDIFYGVELNSLQMFRDTQPHNGYSILSSWRSAAQSRLHNLDPKLEEEHRNKQARKLEGIAIEGYQKDIPGSAFVITSNIDGHFARSGFDSSIRGQEEKTEIYGFGNSNEVHNIHGNVYRWQCAGIPSNNGFALWEKGPCSNSLLDPPSCYQIDYNTMRASFDESPICSHCGGILKPNTYLFGDGRGFAENPVVTKGLQYNAWVESTLESMKENPQLKLTIVEIGCGLRIPSIRKRCEEVFGKANKSQCEFIRINPEYPDNKIIQSPSIPLKGKCLETLEQIQSLIPQ